MDIIVLADTHLKNDINELPKQVVKAIRKSDLLLHAGDFKTLDFYNSLKNIINIRAVYGNMDKNNLKNQLNEKEIFELKGYKIAMIHGNQFNNLSIENLSYLFPEADIIIFGHSHKPLNKRIEGQLFFNPGSAVDKRLQDDYSYGIIKIEDKNVVDKVFSKVIRF